MDTEIWHAVLPRQLLRVHIKDSAYGVRQEASSLRQEASSLHIKFWDTLFITETNRARKLKFGTLKGIYAYWRLV